MERNTLIMAGNVRIDIDSTKYRTPTQEDLNDAKNFILQREEFAVTLGQKVDEILADAAERIVIICYAHNVKPKELIFSSAFNEELMQEIGEVMDETEAEILSLIYEYSTRVTNNRERMSVLALWMASLGKGESNLRETLDNYMYKTMKDWEAAIAAMKYLGVSREDAISKIRMYLHHIYDMPEVLTAIRRRGEFAATYIRFGGVQKGAVGISNNGSTNVVNMARMTLQLTWMKDQMLEFKENGAVGYWQGRGSSFDCAICDDEVGFHTDIEDINNKPFPHFNCCCWRMPIYEKGMQDEDIEFVTSAE